MRATTRPTIVPTVCQAIPMSEVTRVLSMPCAKYATVSSKASVKWLLWPAQGTRSTWTPHVEHSTRRGAYTSQIRSAPNPRCLQRRSPAGS